MTGGVRLAAWSAFLALSLRLLHGAAFGHLSVALGSVDELLAWADRTAPTVMALSAVRLAALAAAWYLAGATVLAIVADVAGWRRAAAVVAALSPAVVRRLASRSAGVGLAAGALLAVVPMPTRLAATPAHASTGPAEDPSPPTATMTRLPPTPPPTADDPTADTTRSASRPLGTTTPPTPPPADDDEPTADTAAPSNASATMTRLGEAGTAAPPVDAMSRLHETPAASPTPRAPAGPGADPAPPTGAGAGTGDRTHDAGVPRAAATDGPPTATMSRLPAAPAAPATPAPAPSPEPAEPSGPEAEQWPVAPGDSFWSIAGEVLADIAGHRADDDEISRYWRQLIAANRQRLLDPANPDLLVPGQQLALPPPA